MTIVELRCCGCGKVFEGENKIENGLYPPCPNCGLWKPQFGVSGGTVRVGSTSELYNWRMRTDVCDECDSIKGGVLFYKGPQEKEPAFVYNSKGNFDNVVFPSQIIKACPDCAKVKITLGWKPFRMEYGKLVPVSQE